MERRINKPFSKRKKKGGNGGKDWKKLVMGRLGLMLRFPGWAPP